MDTTVALLMLIAAIALGAMSPGPSFVLVARIALSSSRRHGIAAALGMGLGVARTFVIGATTQLSNPKTAIVYASVFAALLPPQLPVAASIAVPVLIFMVEFGWYALVAVALSAPAPRGAYARCKRAIDRAAAAAMALLGGKLIVSIIDD